VPDHQVQDRIPEELQALVVPQAGSGASLTYELCRRASSNRPLSANVYFSCASIEDVGVGSMEALANLRRGRRLAKASGAGARKLLNMAHWAKRGERMLRRCRFQNSAFDQLFIK
jgi:hypothetical protein